jgi:hypothetical protein
MSAAVPFYSKGVFGVTKKEREAARGGKILAAHATPCRYVGNGIGNDISYAHCCDVIIGSNNHPQIVLKSDCYFTLYQDGPNLLDSDERQRDIETYKSDPPLDYTELVGDLTLEPINSRFDDDEEGEPLQEPIEIVDEPSIIHEESETVNTSREPTQPGDDSTASDQPSIYRNVPTSEPSKTTQSNPRTIPQGTEWTYPTQDAPQLTEHQKHVQSLEQILLELQTPWVDANNQRPKRHQQIDPAYAEFLELMTKLDTNIHPKVGPEITEPTVGYKLRQNINRHAYRQPPKMTSHFAQINQEMQTMLKETANPPPPVVKHITRAPQGPLDPEIHEALTGPDRDEWWIGYVTENERLGIRTTWEDVTPEKPKPLDKKPIKSKYVCRCTQRADGTWKYRVRLCGCGYSQKPGEDYTDTFAPTAKFKSFTTLMHLAAINNWNIQGLDVENAFLESMLEEEIYMYIPTNPLLKYSPMKTVRLLRTLYGLKQSGERFYDKMKTSLESDGFIRSIHDTCVFTKRNPDNDKTTFVLLYVDDIIITGSDPDGIQNTTDFLASQVEKLTDLGELTRFIGIDIVRDRINGKITLLQQIYIQKIQSTDPIDIGRNEKTPLDSTIDYRVKGDPTKRLEIETGQNRYLADHVRPDILVASSLIGSHARDPHDVHIRGAARMKRFLRGTQTQGLVLGGSSPIIHLFGMCDGSYIPYDDSKGQMGFAIFLNLESGTIQARSHRDTTVSHSSFEIEIKALDELIRALTWIRGFLAELGYSQTGIPTPIYIDNEAALQIGNSYRLTEKISHMVMKLNYIHQEVNAGHVVLKYIDTNNNVADILTKALPGESFERHSHTLREGFDGKPIVPLPTKTELKSQGKSVQPKSKRSVTELDIPDKSNKKQKS